MIPPCDEHRAGRWERDPRTLIYTRRCLRCGHTMERLTQAEMTEMNPAFALRATQK